VTSPKGALWAENCPNFLAGKTEVFSGKFKTYGTHWACPEEVFIYYRKASLNLKGQKIVPIFSFFFVWDGKF
jgi:hypothetical protein